MCNFKSLSAINSPCSISNRIIFIVFSSSLDKASVNSEMVNAFFCNLSLIFSVISEKYSVLIFAFLFGNNLDLVYNCTVR